MRESWVGLQAGVDARRWARVLQRAHDVALRGGQMPTIVRGVIADSWERCSATGVDPAEPGAPLVVDPDDAAERFRDHPLAPMTEVLGPVLGGLVREARHIVVLSDSDGCLLWSDGHPDVLSAAEKIGFTPGHAWSERAAGTNAVGTALAADHAVQVFSAEHYRSEVHGWQCSGAPIHDPETGEPLGAVDVTGRFETASPHTLALVQAAACLVEERLRCQMLERDTRILALFAEQLGHHRAPAAALSPSGRVLGATDTWGPYTRGERLDPGAEEGQVVRADGTAAELQPLGEGRLALAWGPSGARAAAARRAGARGPAARRGGARGRYRLVIGTGARARFITPTAEHRLTIRHSEIAELLARHPDGLDARALSRALYGETGHETAVRAELHRLRDVLGETLVTRPYRLQGVEADLNAPVGDPRLTSRAT